MSTAKEIAVYTVPDVQVMAENVSKSGLFPGINTPQAAFTLMMLAQSEGLHPIQALRRFHIINGRATMRADAMQAEFQANGGKIRWVKTDDKECEAEFSHPSHHPEPVKIRLTYKELEEKKATGTPVWKTWPASMLRARVISQGVKLIMPGVVVGLYTPEEIDSLPSDGPVIDVTPRETPSSLPPGLASRDGINAAFPTAKANSNSNSNGNSHTPTTMPGSDDLEEHRDRSWAAYSTRRAQGFNRDWCSWAAANNIELTTEALRAPVNRYQLTQAVAELALADELADEPGDGKHTVAWAGPICDRLFASKFGWIKAAVKGYLEAKRDECKAAVCQPSLPLDSEGYPEPGSNG